MLRSLLALALLALSATAPAAPRGPAIVRVDMVTSFGKIVIDVDARRAPVTAANFLRYVDNKRFDATNFYRAARTVNNPGHGFVQGGTRHDYRRIYPPIAHEPTSKTGILHTDGTISMARNEPGSAMGDFFITVGPIPSMDAKPGKPGYAAFGHVVSGMEVVKRILAVPTVSQTGNGSMKGQMIVNPIKIISVSRAARQPRG
jgi:peptidyl-prolyl cis-trans isomerase A (cyclophilin A)